MGYDSLIEEYEIRFSNECSDFTSTVVSQMFIRAPLESIIYDLEQAHHEDGEISLLKQIFHPPRLIRSVLDYCSSRSDQISGDVSLMKEQTQLKGLAVEIALSLYRRDSDALDKLSAFKGYLKEHHPKLIQAEVHQKDDVTTWNSSSYFNCGRYASANIDSYFGGRDILLIPLAHGGVMSGLDHFLRYTGQNGLGQSQIFPVRFSIIKNDDKVPQISPHEINHLKKLVDNGLLPIIYDEDSHSGDTINQAIDFFEDEVFGNYGNFEVIVNNDCAKKKVTTIPSSFANQDTNIDPSLLKRLAIHFDLGPEKLPEFFERAKNHRSLMVLGQLNDLYEECERISRVLFLGCLDESPGFSDSLLRNNASQIVLRRLKSLTVD